MKSIYLCREHSKSLLFAAILLITTGCHRNTFDVEIMQHLSPVVTKAVVDIAKYDMIYEDAVGRPRSIVHDSLPTAVLIYETSIPELLCLIKHSSTEVRAYAFFALAKRKYVNLAEVYSTQTRSRRKLNLQMSCIVEELTYLDYMNLIVSPDSWVVDVKKLDKSAIVVKR